MSFLDRLVIPTTAAPVIGTAHDEELASALIDVTRSMNDETTKLHRDQFAVLSKQINDLSGAMADHRSYVEYLGVEELRSKVEVLMVEAHETNEEEKSGVDIEKLAEAVEVLQTQVNTLIVENGGGEADGVNKPMNLKQVVNAVEVLQTQLRELDDRTTSQSQKETVTHIEIDVAVKESEDKISKALESLSNGLTGTINASVSGLQEKITDIGDSVIADHKLFTAHQDKTEKRFTEQAGIITRVIEANVETTTNVEKLEAQVAKPAITKETEVKLNTICELYDMFTVTIKTVNTLQDRMTQLEVLLSGTGAANNAPIEHV